LAHETSVLWATTCGQIKIIDRSTFTGIIGRGEKISPDIFWGRPEKMLWETIFQSYVGDGLRCKTIFHSRSSGGVHSYVGKRYDINTHYISETKI
jgi:hypothetical protein